jgi:hypothetical protein
MVLLKMYMCSNEEYMGIHFVYGFCSGNVTAEIQEFDKWFPVWANG